MPAGMTPITSRTNPQFKLLRALAASAKERRTRRRMLLDGPHLLSAFLDHGGRPESVAVSATGMDRSEIRSLLARTSPCPALCLADDLFAAVAPVDHPAGILAVAPVPSPQAHALGPCVVMLEQVQDPGNVGTIVRTAAAAGASDVLASAGCADPWSPRTLRAGMGGHFALRVHADVDLVEAARGFDGKLVATVARGGLAPHAADLTGRTAFLFGSEGMGLDVGLQRHAQVAVSIPMAHGVESLNVGAAAAVLLFERVRQLAVRSTGRLG
jgi:TrmH family RNA methyltransferase